LVHTVGDDGNRSDRNDSNDGDEQVDPPVRAASLAVVRLIHCVASVKRDVTLTLGTGGAGLEVGGGVGRDNSHSVVDQTSGNTGPIGWDEPASGVDVGGGVGDVHFHAQNARVVGVGEGSGVAVKSPPNMVPGPLHVDLALLIRAIPQVETVISSAIRQAAAGVRIVERDGENQVVRLGQMSECILVTRRLDGIVDLRGAEGECHGDKEGQK